MNTENFYLVLTHPAIINGEDKFVGAIIPLLQVMDAFIEGIVCTSMESARHFSDEVMDVQEAINSYYHD